MIKCDLQNFQQPVQVVLVLIASPLFIKLTFDAAFCDTILYIYQSIIIVDPLQKQTNHKISIEEK